MKIAIQAADLDHPRIDGTRVYIKNMLKYFGALDHSSEFLIYHKNKFNPELQPADFPNYKIIRKNWPLFWTQTCLAPSLWRKPPDALWMPMHNIPYFKPRSVKTFVTIHDLAFKYFPECFMKWERLKLNFLANLAITRSDKIITISQSSKKDILKFYPRVKEDRIRVIYHGFDKEIFSSERDPEKEREIKNNLKIKGEYILYIGAIQPRKNLAVLIKAFEKIKKEYCHSGLSASPAGGDPESSLESKNSSKNLKLVLAGEKAWLWQDIFAQIEKSSFRSDIITPGKIKFSDLGHLMRGARIFCFPSLYEGFGLPVLEALAAGVPAVCARNSSLPEVAGKAALYFSGGDSEELAEKLKNILENNNLRNELIRKGLAQAKKFSWEKCARETLEYIKS